MLMNFLKYALSALMIAVLASCKGYLEDITDDPSGGDDPSQPGLTISVDKDVIEADGKDKAVFSLVDADGRELTTDAEIRNVYFYNKATGKALPRKSVSFSAIINGEYEFYAKYKGQQSKNTVVIKVQNRKKYEEFSRKVVIYKLTGTWCGFCPQMNTALSALSDDTKNHILELACHSAGGGEDPFALKVGSLDLGSTLLQAFSGQGYPSLVYNLDKLSGNRAVSVIEDEVMQQRIDNPATCGVKIESTVVSSTQAEVKATLKASKSGDFDLACALLLDNQYYPAGTASDGMYSHIVKWISPNFLSMKGSATRFTLEAGKEHSVTFSIQGDFSEKGNMRVAVIALRDVNKMSPLVDNANECALGASVDYLYNNDEVVRPEEPEGQDKVLKLIANKEQITANGAEEVTFKVMYGSEDVTAKARLLRTFNGEEEQMKRGVNVFSTTVPGTYSFKASYYFGKEFISQNECQVVAVESGQKGNYYQKMLGVQFTSVGCTFCPKLSQSLENIQASQPNRLAVVSFHKHLNGQDPMYIEWADKLYNKMQELYEGDGGLPAFYLNGHGNQIVSEQYKIEAAMKKEMTSYPTMCGVAILSKLEGDQVTVTARVTSETEAKYRYLIYLVEDGITKHFQAGADGLYTHNNVVRAVLANNLFGERLNKGNALVSGQEYTAERTATLGKDWVSENMRVVVAVMASNDGGSTYYVTNCNECKLGESAGYLYK